MLGTSIDTALKSHSFCNSFYINTEYITLIHVIHLNIKSLSMCSCETCQYNVRDTYVQAGCIIRTS